MSFRTPRSTVGAQEDDEDSETKSTGSNDGWGLLERACHFFESRPFQGELDKFAREHGREFGDAVQEEEKTEDHTHKIRYSELHGQYLRLVENLLSGFLEEEGRPAEDLFSDMKDAKENNYTALFEEHEYHDFVQSVLAAIEYQSFYRLMLAAAAEATTTRQGRKGSGSSTGSDRGSNSSDRGRGDCGSGESFGAAGGDRNDGERRVRSARK